jgi:hypothetical protein
MGETHHLVVMPVRTTTKVYFHFGKRASLNQHKLRNWGKTAAVKRGGAMFA